MTALKYRILLAAWHTTQTPVAFAEGLREIRRTLRGLRVPANLTQQEG